MSRTPLPTRNPNLSLLRRLGLIFSFASVGLAACGGGGGSTITSTAATPVISGTSTSPAPAPAPTPTASSTLVPTIYDGVGTAAQFFGWLGLATDSSNSLYIADDSTVRKMTTDGSVITMAGLTKVPGNVDGTGAAARFTRPIDLAVDKLGNVYVTTLSNTIRKISPEGVVSTLAGVAGATGYIDGTGSIARFNSPGSIAIDAAGTLYVADFWNGVIRKISSSGTVSTLAGSPCTPQKTCSRQDGTGSSARFIGPMGLAFDVFGNLLVADSDGEGNNAIRAVTPAGAVSTVMVVDRLLGGSITVDSANTIYFSIEVPGNSSNSGNSESLAKISSGVLSSLAGVVSEGSFTGIYVPGYSSPAKFTSLGSLTVDSLGNVYASEGNVIRKITPAGNVTTIAGKPSSP